MRHQDLIVSLYQIGAVQFGEFVLKSGQVSSIYINLRKIISFPPLLRQIANAMWETVDKKKIDLVCGVPYTALPIATCISLDHDLPMIIRRKEKKDYGTKQLIEGLYQSNQRVLIIEDIVTTGGSIIETASDLKEAGLAIAETIALIDREQGGKKNLEAQFPFRAILTLSDILTTLVNEPSVNAEDQERIQQFILKRSA